MTTSALVVLGIELPPSVEHAAIDFMKEGSDWGLFTSKMIQLGIIGEMRRLQFEVDNLPANWARRVADALIRRESKAGHIEKHGPGGPATFWKWADSAAK